jgi:hypothetical protein
MDHLHMKPQVYGLGFTEVKQNHGVWNNIEPHDIPSNSGRLPKLALTAHIVLPVTYRNFYSELAHCRPNRVRNKLNEICEAAKDIQRMILNNYNNTVRYNEWRQRRQAHPHQPYLHPVPDILYPEGMTALALDVSIGTQQEFRYGMEWLRIWIPPREYIFKARGSRDGITIGSDYYEAVRLRNGPLVSRMRHGGNVS